MYYSNIYGLKCARTHRFYMQLICVNDLSTCYASFKLKLNVVNMKLDWNGELITKKKRKKNNRNRCADYYFE